MEYLQIEWTPIVDENETKRLKKKLYTLTYNHKKIENARGFNEFIDTQNLKSVFPVATPVQLSKRDVEFLKENDYWVSEKSNGIKVLVMILSSGVYICDSRFNFYFIDADTLKIPVEGQMDVQQDMTLLDSELTYNYHYDKYCLMICDVVSINGEFFSEFTLSKRLRGLRDKLIIPLRQKYTEDQMADLPVQILGKDFFKLHQIINIFSYITKYEDDSEPSGSRYLYHNGKRYNDNDGLIFSREELPYRPNRCISLKRWNWEHFNTVNFKVSVFYIENKPSIRLYLMNPMDSELLEFRKVFFSRSCTERMINELQGESTAIVECSYNREKGNWVYYSIKKHILEPDKMSDMLLLLETVAEDISKKYLIHQFSKSKDIVYESPQQITSGIKRKSDDHSPALKKKRE
jgi:mRNA guanylyltransferase